MKITYAQRPPQPALADLATPAGLAPVPILLYHSVDPTPAADRYRPWVVTPALFDQHLSMLAEAGYCVVPMGDLIAARRGERDLPPGKVAAITFDDGLADFADHALPLLTKHKVPSTLFVTSGYVGGSGQWLAPLGEGDRPMLDWAGVRAVEAAGVEIGGHSHTHPMMDLLPAARLADEVNRCKGLLEDQLGHVVGGFAYPFGYHNRSVRRAVAGAGHRWACTVGHTLSHPGDDVFALGRVVIRNDTTPALLAAHLAGQQLRHLPVGRQALRTHGWRLARRSLAAGRAWRLAREVP